MGETTAARDAANLRDQAWDRLEPILELFERALNRGERPDLDALCPRWTLPSGKHCWRSWPMPIWSVAWERRNLPRRRLSECAFQSCVRAELLLDLIQTEYQMRRLREPGLGPPTSSALPRAWRGRGQASRGPAQRRPNPAMTAKACADPAQELAGLTGSLPVLKQLGDFRLLREIGHGGMGVVYEAFRCLGPAGCAQILPQKLLADKHTRQRFEREAKAAARLHHTNIVPVFRHCEQDGVPYYVMQFIRAVASTSFCRAEAAANRRRHARLPPTEDAEEQRVKCQDASAAEVARFLLSGQFAAGTDVEVGRIPIQADRSKIGIRLRRPVCRQLAPIP